VISARHIAAATAEEVNECVGVAKENRPNFVLWRISALAKGKNGTGRGDALRIISTLSIIGFFAFAALSNLAHAQQPTVVVSAYAASVDQYRKYLFDPFEKMCNCKVITHPYFLKRLFAVRTVLRPGCRQ
jgi:hypothetical protein